MGSGAGEERIHCPTDLHIQERLGCLLKMPGATDNSYPAHGVLQAELLRQQEREVKRMKQELAVDQASAWWGLSGSSAPGD